MKTFLMVVAAALIVLTALPLIKGCAPVQEQAHVRNGKTYGTTEGLFRNRWWNFYERGISFGDGEFLDEAESDFREAIRQRSEDQRTARTYGMHFVDYFPRRELGIILFKQQRYPEAIAELERSIASEESAKAKFYLNEARKSLLKTRVQDTAPPTIAIDAPAPGSAVNGLSVTVSGRASDDHYVSGISVNGVPEFIELSGRTLTFEKTVALSPGPNTITIQALDLMGNVETQTLTVTADYQGPNLSVVNYVDHEQVDTRDITVTLAYFDASGIDHVRLAGQSVSPGGALSGTLSASVRLENGMNRIPMEAVDRAGNQSSGTLSILCYPKNLTAANAHANLATDAVTIATKTDDQTPPEIRFTGLLKTLSDNEPITMTGRKTSNQIFIEGQASDPAGVEEVLINDVPVPIRPGKMIVFNRLVEFKEGENRFRIAVRNTREMAAERAVTVNRRIQQIDLDESKMTLSVMPFKINSVSGDLAETVYQLFLQELMNSGRFNLVERGPDFEAVLKELKLSQTDLVDKDKAVAAGRLLASESIMIGSIVEKEREVEIYAKLINVETSEFLTVQDVYGQDTSREHLGYLAAGLAAEIVYSIPLIEGSILAVKGNEYYLDMGRDTHFNLKNGIKCLAFRTTPFVVDGVHLGDETSVLGTLVIQQINPKFSSAVLNDSKEKQSGPDIQKSDHVITK